ncbi:hypothetical protein NEF87_003046 [Candidatus Lokiarchaeum ossiferum]|uniref:site-specific DNA-methyltransferase (adenine-specific) n=1 Tax=Candidatus Lokiarchaeum ossiferum TaxID=2951803 RepID=A0ABY6HTL9_9ARCH|nr:hypothetical protein NEF87_003046 [Candidatus Lokiarchaeum sp. B-35]
MFSPTNLKQKLYQQIRLELSTLKKKNLPWDQESSRTHYWNVLMQMNLQETINLIKNGTIYDEIADPLGAIYHFFFQHYLKWDGTQLRIIEKTPRLRESGRVYTPEEIIYYIIQLLTKKQNSEDSNHDESIKVADIACGTGRFLTQWWIQDQESQLSSEYHFNVENYYGYDIDGTAISLSKHSLIPNAVWKETDALFDPELDTPHQFNVILGNPPYIESRAIPDKTWASLRKKYKCAYKKFDISVVFLEKIVTLLKPSGFAGLILTNKWMVSSYGMKIRELLLTQTKIHYIIDVSQLPIFHNVATYPVIIILQKKECTSESISQHKIHIAKTETISDLKTIISNETSPLSKNFFIDQSYFLLAHDFIISTDLNSSNIKLIEYLMKLPKENYFYIGSKSSPYILRKGIHTGNVKDKLIFKKQSSDSNLFKKLITSRDKVEKFKIKWNGLWVHYNSDLIDRSQGDYGSLRDQWIFEAKPKIMIKLFGTQIQAALDRDQYYANNSIILLVRKNDAEEMRYPFLSLFQSHCDEYYYLLGILNSTFISTYYRALFSHSHVRGDYLQFYIKDLQKIPIMIPTQENLSVIQEIIKVTKELEKFSQENLKANSNKKNIAKESKLERLIKELYKFEHKS